MKTMDPQAALRLLGFVKEGRPPPPEITALKAKIEGETKAAELAFSVSGQIDQTRVDGIVRMKRELDSLYVKWGEGTL